MTGIEREIERIDDGGDAWADTDEIADVEFRRPLDVVVPVRLSSETWRALRKEASALGVGPSMLLRMEGARSMRYRWPNGNQCAVVLTFDPDAESGLVFGKPHEAGTRLDEMEERRFGVRTGIPRILRLLEQYQLPSTWFVPGYTIVHHTEVIRTVQAAGHELGAHGNVHEPPHLLDEAAERRVMEEQLGIFEQHLGVRPKGYRAPGASVKVGTPALLKEFGFVYHSNLMGDDLPYFLDTPHGRLVEVPTSWLLNDAPFYRHVYGAPNQMADPEQVVGQWLQEFRGMYRENGCYVMIVHPYISGRASRIYGLERLIRAIRQEPGVWFATALEVAQWALETGQNADVKVPLPDPSAGTPYLSAQA